MGAKYVEYYSDSKSAVSRQRELIICRKFWQEYLPRLKYHNPAIPMIVNRHGQNDASPLMTIYLRKAGTSASTESHAQAASSRTGASKAQPPGDDERTVQIDMKDKHSTNILDHFIAETGAVPLQPTKEEVSEMQSLEEMRKKAAVDRDRVGQLRAEKKREEDMLKRARAAGGAAETGEA